MAPPESIKDPQDAVSLPEVCAPEGYSRRALVRPSWRTREPTLFSRKGDYELN